MDSVNTDRGLWLLNPDDPSYNGGSPSLPGWRVGKLINSSESAVARLECLGASYPWGSGSDRLKPQLWIAGGIGPSTFKNIALGRARSRHDWATSPCPERSTLHVWARWL